VEKLRATLPELPSARRARLQTEWQLSDLDMTALTNAGALDLVAATVAAGATPADASKWWLGELRQRANAERVELSALAELTAGGKVLTSAEMSGAGELTASGEVLTPAQVASARAVARVNELVKSGALNDQLARQVLVGMLDREGSPDEVIAARGLAIVSDDGELLAVVDEAIAANPDVVAKIRSGKTAAAGVLVGAVMKATRGQADATRVRELILERLS
jgi:aspartyl-tRNA(Asn)/glutamyl-tRNA(Gln) amidotransferase subunit B